MEFRRLLRTACLFGLGFLVLSAALQWWYLEMVANDGHETEMAAALADRKTEIDFLFLGDSHVMKAVDTRLVPGSFSYTATGENYTLNRLRLERLLATGIRPKTVVLPFDLHGFAHARRDMTGYDDFWVRQPAYLELGWEKGRFLAHFRRHVRAHAFGYVGNYRRIAYAIHPSVPRYARLDADNWMHVNLKGMAFMDADLDEDGRLAAVEHFGGGQAYPNADLEADFQRMLKMCRAEGIAVRLVRYPVSGAYWGRAAELLGADAVRPLTEYVFGADTLPVFDAALRFRAAPAYFLDGHHLNTTGKRVFSTALAVWLGNR